MVPIILTLKGLRSHPLFAIGEELRDVPGAEGPPRQDAPRWVEGLLERLDRLGKTVLRVSLAQEASVRELQSALAALPETRLPESADQVGKLAGEFLPLMDSLGRLAEAIQKEGNSALTEGARLVLGKGEHYLAALSVEAIPAVGQRFDPHLHEALGGRTAPPEMQGRILEEVVRGYRRGTTLLRASRVIVGKE